LLRVVRILFAVGGLVVPGIAAASTPDEDLCASTPASAEVIAACSRLLDGATAPSDRAWVFTLRARARSDQGDLTGAVTDYSAALTLQPKYDSALNGRAVAYLKMRSYDLALRDSTQAIGLKPDDAEYYNSRGLTYREMGDPTKAIADLDQAIKLMPNYAIAFNNRGTADNDLRQPDRAIEDFKQAIKLSPNYALAYYNLGETENDAKGDYDQAIADLTTALKLNPSLGPAWLNRGIAYARSRNTAAALADFNKVIAMQPDRAEVYRDRGSLYLTNDDNAHALADFDKAVSLDPQDARGAVRTRRRQAQNRRQRRRQCRHRRRQSARSETRRHDGKTARPKMIAGRSSVAYGNSATCSSPIVSGKPSMTFIFCTAWPDAPFVRLSSAATIMARPGMRSAATPMKVMLEPRTWRVCGTLPYGSRWTNGSFA